MSSETPNGGHSKPPIPAPAKKDPAWNIEKRGDRLYQATSLHKWFAISSLLLFVFTVITIMADYSREWKKYQRNYARLTIERARQDRDKANVGLDRTKLTQLVQQMRAAKQFQDDNAQKVDALQKELDKLNADFYRIDTDLKNARAIYGTDKYTLDEAVAKAAQDKAKQPEAEAARKALDKDEKKVNELAATREDLSAKIAAKKAELDPFIGTGVKARKDYDEAMAAYNRAKTQLGSLDPGFVVTSIRNAPVMDMLNASEKVQQILLSNLYNEQPFKQIPRVDRCTTCHLGIDNPKNANLPQPYKSHPNLDLYLASASPHPLENFGCTTCHGGLDRSTGFQDAGHTPKDEKQKEEWVRKYGWYTDEFLVSPMFASDQVEAGCYKCHNASADVPLAPKLDNGRDLIRIYGCFGCHKIPGYEGFRKVGPDLATVSGKLTKEWVRKWLEDPKAFKSEARMPRFWNNSNNSGPKFEKRNAAEINAITEYLWSKSKPKVLPVVNPSGNAAHGKELVETIGCFGCHAAGPIDQSSKQTQTRRRFGYNLAAQGSKVSPSWIYNWVKNPKLVWPETKMPSLRLTDAEAADITAYLSSLKNDPWTAKPLPKVDTAALDDVVKEFLRNGSTETEAADKLKKMSLDEKNLYAGERLIRRYGCFGCHNIPGMEKEQPIGTELTEAGSKLVSQLDFGFLPIEHDRASWYLQKLHDPRIFDVGRVKTPEELLRMPNFTFNDADAKAIALVLTSLVKDKVPQEMREQVPAAVIAGRQLVDEKNCKGCHVIEKMGGDIRVHLKDSKLWPPDLNTEGFKTQPNWLMRFIKDPGMMRIRTALDARMPTFHFTDKEIDAITAYFSTLDKVDFPLVNTYVETTPEQLKTGAELFTKLQCTKCHPTGSSNPTTPQKEWAPNLNLTQSRLRPDWIPVWLQDPQKIFPGAGMPASWPDYPKSAIKDVYNGDAKAQIQAVRDHIFVTLGGGQKATATN